MRVNEQPFKDLGWTWYRLQTRNVTIAAEPGSDRVWHTDGVTMWMESSERAQAMGRPAAAKPEPDICPCGTNREVCEYHG